MRSAFGSIVAMIKSEEAKEEGREIYEVGYLVASSLSEDKLGGLVGSIKNAVIKNEGVIISEEYPKLRDLAYSMFKTIGHKKEIFTNAYFGWIKFELNRGTISVIKKMLDENESIIRSLITSTVRGNTMVSPRRQVVRTNDRPRPEKTPIMSDEEMEKTVAALVAE